MTRVSDEEADVDPNLKVLQEEIRHLRKEREVMESMIRAGQKGENPWNPLAMIGAVVGLLGVMGTALIGYFGTGDGNSANRQAVVCEQAYMIVSDETLNPALSEAQSKALISDQLQILAKCGKFLP